MAHAGFMFSRAYGQIFPRLTSVTRFPARWASHTLSCASRRTEFPALTSGNIFSRACNRLHVFHIFSSDFPRLALVTCFHFEFWLVVYIFLLSCDWLLSFPFHDSQENPTHSYFKMHFVPFRWKLMSIRTTTKLSVRSRKRTNVWRKLRRKTLPIKKKRLPSWNRE